MEERAASIGKPNFFYYISPNNGQWLPTADAEAVEALGLGGHVVSDLHTGACGGVEAAKLLFARFPNKTFAAGNADTNYGHHTMGRASREAADLNAWFNCFE